MKIEKLETFPDPNSIDPIYKVQLTFSASIYDIEPWMGPKIMEQVYQEFGKDILTECKRIIEERNKQ